MPKFTKQYTTKEQSEKLLKLGIPKWSADCYYDPLINDDKSWIYVRYDESYWMYGDAIPCWSTGRLIEIFNICNEYMDLVELAADPGEMIKEIDTAIMDDVFDLGKLDDYK